jgi:hypothetical protein
MIGLRYHDIDAHVACTFLFPALLGCMALMCNDLILEVKYLGLVSMFDLELED